MPWNTFFTIVLQCVIGVCVIGTVGVLLGALGASILREVRKANRSE